jgi:glycosyltransferase involved in cell wall biosynthesis
VTISLRRQHNAKSIDMPGTTFAPIMLHEVELTEPITALARVPSLSGTPYAAAQSLVRLNGQPIGICEVVLTAEGLSRESFAAAIFTQHGEAINRRLLALGHATISAVPVDGIACEPACESDAYQQPFVSIVIATRNRPETLAATVQDLRDSGYPAFEIIVVDNAPSDDATRETVTAISRTDSRVRYLCEERKGVSWARNLGLAAASADIVAFLDDDLKVDRNWLWAITRAFTAADNVGCVSGMILPLEMETTAQQFIEEYGGYCKGFERTIYNLGEHRPNHPLFPFAAGIFGSGANLAFRTPFFRAIGGFDPAVGAGTPALGGEDLAAMFHIIASGYSLVYEPAAIVHHRHYREYEALQRQMFSYGAGLTAFLTQAVMTRPRMLPQMLRNVPRGVRYALSATSPKNARKHDDYPRALTLIEWRGMAYGPLAYLRGRVQARRLGSHRRTTVSMPWAASAAPEASVQ